MTQAISIIRDALQYIRVADANAVLDENDTADALRALNQMMRTLEVDGLSLGWQDVPAAADEMPTPPEADEAIGYGLAVRLAPRYGVQPDAATAQMAASTLAVLRANVLSNLYERCSYDDLPRGDAQRPGGGWRAGFYR